MIWLFQGAVANEWQGVIFLMLDLLDKFSISLINVVHVSILCFHMKFCYDCLDLYDLSMYLAFAVIIVVVV